MQLKQRVFPFNIIYYLWNEFTFTRPFELRINHPVDMCAQRLAHIQTPGKHELISVQLWSEKEGAVRFHVKHRVASRNHDRGSDDLDRSKIAEATGMMIPDGTNSILFGEIRSGSPIWVIGMMIFFGFKVLLVLLAAFTSTHMTSLVLPGVAFGAVLTFVGWRAFFRRGRLLRQMKAALQSES